MFSPYYAAARRRGPADPMCHCAVNIALYGDRYKHWALTERSTAVVAPDGARLAIGRSVLHWDGVTLAIDLDEMTFPLPARVRGQVRLTPAALRSERVALDRDGRHHWRPLAPCARVDVDLAHPSLRWSGRGYLDGNRGDAPLEDAFSQWHWSRTTAGTDTLVHYDVARRDGSTLALATRFAADGASMPLSAGVVHALPATGWRIARAARSATGHAPRVIRTLEDTPFYARTLLQADDGGHAAIHESLSLDRFRTRWVRALLPFRMPRVA